MTGKKQNMVRHVVSKQNFHTVFAAVTALHACMPARIHNAVAYPGILFGGGSSTNSVEDRGQTEWGSGGSSPLVRGSGGSCNSVQEISFHIVKFS